MAIDALNDALYNEESVECRYTVDAEDIRTLDEQLSVLKALTTM